MVGITKNKSKTTKITIPLITIPLRMVLFGRGKLISRAEAKYIIKILNQAHTVVLDFDGVKSIGQGFADELFRVYQNKHPTTKITAINANDEINGMISHVVNTEKINKQTCV